MTSPTAPAPPAAVLDEKKNFLGIADPDLCSFGASEFVVQSIPYEHTSSYRAGSAAGPAAILEASHYVEFYDEMLGRETYRNGICTLAPLQIEARDQEAVNAMDAATARLLAAGKRVVTFGAEHTVTLGLVQAHARQFANLSVLQIDAHSDLRDRYQGNRFSHACVMARVRELGLNICQVGIRAQCAEEAKLIGSDPRIHTFYAHHLRNNPDWMNEVVSSLTANVYVTIDADGFDPSVVPAVGTPEPGGLFWDETVALLARVAAAKRIVGFDVVELAPLQGDSRSQYTLAKLAYRLMGLISNSPPGE
jgi:agmatinase